MGSQFSIVFDIISVAIVVLMFFAGWRKGLASMVIGLCAAVVAFVAAMTLSNPIAEWVYDTYVEEPLTAKLEEGVESSFSSLSLNAFTDVEYESMFISDVAVDKIVPEYSGRDSVVMDLSNVDMSLIGLTAEDLNFLGMDTTFDLTSINMKTAEFTKSEVEKYGLGKLVVSQFIAVSLIEKGDFAEFNNFVGIISDYIPGKPALTGADSITVSYVRKLVMSMLDTRAELGDTVINNFVRPNCIVVIRTIAFILIYSIVFAVLRFIASAAKLIDKIPIIGDVNSMLGGIAGLVEGILILFIFCLATRLIVSVFDGDVMIFNQETIEKTFIFKKVYEFNFLNFLT
ncbi:MAG: CvpA family protein [Oscillospiraceae bacterium]